MSDDHNEERVHCSGRCRKSHALVNKPPSHQERQCKGIDGGEGDGRAVDTIPGNIHVKRPNQNGWMRRGDAWTEGLVCGFKAG